MANHKSALKRIRQSDTKRLLNKYQHKTTRNAVRKLQMLTEKKAALDLLPKVSSMLDKLTKRNIIHKNKSANIKSKLAKHISSLYNHYQETNDRQHNLFWLQNYPCIHLHHNAHHYHPTHILPHTQAAKSSVLLQSKKAFGPH